MIKRKIRWLIGLLAASVLLTMLFRASSVFTMFYSRHIFVPLQSVRGFVWQWVKWSIGDVIYIAAGTLVLATLTSWLWYIFYWRAAKGKFYTSCLNLCMAVAGVYLWFLLGWAGNYYKEPLRATWQLDAINDTLELQTFDSLLVTRLNHLAPLYSPVSEQDRDVMALQNIQLFTDAQVAGEAIGVKYSAFSYFLQRMAIDGYYNPFTGEGQITDRLPQFMEPFVINHEMAHQLGIASEGDANLVAYAVGSASPYPLYNYSAALNLWLYVDARLSRRDSVVAQQWESRLNSLTRAHIDTLEQLAELYDNDASKYGATVYDGYLKMQQQKDGIRSYGGVTADAWRLEIARRRGLLPQRLHLP